MEKHRIHQHTSNKMPVCVCAFGVPEISFMEGDICLEKTGPQLRLKGWAINL